MIDIKIIRQNPKKIKKDSVKKGVKVDIDHLLKVDQKKRENLLVLEQIRAEKNKASKDISKTKNSKEKKKIISEMKKLDEKNDRLKNALKKLEKELNDLMLQIPNPAFDDVPVGEGEKGNKVLREVEKKTRFDFKPKSYMEIAERLDLIDVKRAAKTSGTRFGFLKKEIALLEFALINFALEEIVNKGFIPVIPPVMLKDEMARGTGYFEATDKNEAYFLPKDNLFLAGTSEQSLIAMHAEEVFKKEDLPKRYVAFSTCFRREAGSYGKDTKGILRVHQFDKVEMVSFCNPEDSKKEHLFLLEIQERLMKALKIPYQVVQIGTGDLGRPAAAKYDIESWMPSENRYRETHSTSNCTDFQARRLNIKYRDKTNKLALVHTLNGTVFAIGRILIMIIENNQQKDGSIFVPQVLQKYLGFNKIG